MPIPVVCANCQTRLNAPDAAAGRKVKCPKCQTVMAVPGAADAPPPLPPPPTGSAGTPFDFGGEPPPPPRRPSGESRSGRPAPSEPAAPPAGGAAFDFGAAVSSGAETKGRGDREERGDRPRRRRDEDDAPPPDRGDRPRRPRPDDAPDDDDRPRGRRPSGDGKKKSPVLLILLILGAVLMLCCVGPAGAYFFVIQPKIKEAADKFEQELKKISDDAKKNQNPPTGGGSSAVPAGWVKYESKDVRAYFPVEPTEETMNMPGPKSGTPTMKKYTAAAPGETVMAGLVVMKFPTAAPAAQKTATMERMANGLAGGAKADATDVTWMGQKAKEFVIREPGGPGEMVVRQVLIGNTAFVGTIGFKGARQQDQVDGFFNNVEALSK